MFIRGHLSKCNEQTAILRAIGTFFQLQCHATTVIVSKTTATALVPCCKLVAMLPNYFCTVVPWHIFWCLTYEWHIWVTRAPFSFSSNELQRLMQEAEGTLELPPYPDVSVASGLPCIHKHSSAQFGMEGRNNWAALRATIWKWKWK